MTIKTVFRLSLAASALALAAGAAQAQAPVKACLITKTDINPFFVKMKEGATAKARELGIELMTFAGKIDGDHETQQQAVESCIAAGAKGILITASDTKAIVDSVSQARDAGILVIALDTPLEPIDAADATFATDNREAGRLIGAWAAGKLGDAAADARIAMLDLSAAGATVDVLRDQGFLEGFGVDVKNENVIGDEDDPRIVGHEITSGNEEGGLGAMEALLQRDPNINVVYTINEPAAAGAYEALKSFGKEQDVLIVSVDGGCPGVENVAAGIIGATSQQYPLLMAAHGIEAIAAFAEDGTKPESTEGLDFVNTGVNLVTGEPVDGVPSISIEEGTEQCWG
ncbi:mannose-binding protein /fructose-binding protein /ribose-binding protein [Paracoccus alcaliphilus]|uniref:Mannose-binding protein /fructose-binding protein /ribose-binding protein n=1 Tax=Paracoccus alcaliphilus TaxID=34002 RepID=A0A1H8KR75_9RHOB|nr:sugar ABC transporter substrate-binding protein [Paracoccus alcaliphilus]WCR20759.1 sugar ABC transporter substrate-binding protein [Paracoccus alcaliphilus]SEN95365.1 mannose-binding protein /fructose-binding protein /ribose-binding protein [Paracoccus alcaliphilus]